VRLGAVGLPELGRGGGAQGVDAAAGFVSADGPGGEGGDFAEVGGVVGVTGCLGGVEMVLENWWVGGGEVSARGL